MSDHIPPHNLDAELYCLGAILLKPETLSECISKFPAMREFFYDLRHTAIFNAMLDLEKAQRPVEKVALSQLLKDRGWNGDVAPIAFLASLEDKSCAGGAVEHVEMLRDLYIRRESIRIGVEMQRRGYSEDDVESLVAANMKAVSDLSDLRANAGERRMLDLAHITLEALDLAVKNKGKGPQGLTCGLPGIDRILGGFRPGQLIIVAARPGFGKTSFAMQSAEHVAIDSKVPAAVFSLEMSDEALVFRTACSRAQVDSVKAREGELNPMEERRLSQTVARISQCPMHIYPLRGANMTLISSIARRAVAKHGVKLIVVDYLQLIHGGKKNYSNRTAEITEVSGALKSLAMELNLPIICPAQLNRSNDQEQRKPRLSDLRDSGSIEQDADVVLFLHPAKDANVEGEIVPTDGIVAKQREGRVGTIPLEFRKVYTRFEMRDTR